MAVRNLWFLKSLKSLKDNSVKLVIQLTELSIIGVFILFFCFMSLENCGVLTYKPFCFYPTFLARFFS